MAAKKISQAAAIKHLRALGLTFPGAHLKSPWPNHLDLAVNDKTFAYLSVDGEPFSISCKLPNSNEVAIMLPFCKPTGYGLGRSGWVTASLAKGETPQTRLFEQWLVESYRAQAPKRMVKLFDAGERQLAPAKSSKSSARASANKPARETKTPKKTKAKKARTAATKKRRKSSGTKRTASTARAKKKRVKRPRKSAQR